MKRRSANPTNWAETIAARQPMARSVADDVMAKLYSAFGDLKAGSTDDDLFDRLAAAINVGVVRAEQIDQACVAPMLAARDALIRCDDIRGRHGRYGFDGPGLLAMAVGLEVYEEMVRNSTPQQMREAMTASIARMRRQGAAEGAQQ
ncbi:hypothetical protein [Variovorax sp. 38R]|uniref:hypothetical protein n=1 Tax=Variovorax sp. 38R TaxID=2774875 RepID=UPI0017817E1F|nr:hypothetical protein [Variovorax sp. 38R]QOF80315.1 hypothetical protein IG196_07985 [Variovorax sp. 38R]